jgi:methionyl-tRNA formyltransferase
MNVVFITINDRHFLPGLFEKALSKTHPDDVFRALLVRPLYKNETVFSMARRYLRTFGFREFASFSLETCVRIVQGALRKPKRGRPLHSVKAVFQAYGYEVLATDRNVNEPVILEQLERWKTDVIISVGCPQIFKKAFIALPRKACLNLHGAPLPRYRGMLPSFWMLKNGEDAAANTLFFVNEKLDAGDVLLQESFPIRADDTLHSLIKKSKWQAGDMIARAIEMIRSGDYVTRPLAIDQGSYFGWPTKKDVREFWARGRKLR